MEDIFAFVKEEDERVLCRFGNTAARLKRDGARQFLVPGSAGGVVLIAFGLFISRLLEGRAGDVAAYTLTTLGVCIALSSLLLYAMFCRRARQAQGYSLVLTNKNVVWCSFDSYVKLPLSDIKSASVERSHVFDKIPFDMSMLEERYILLFYRGADMRLSFIDSAEDAAQKINSLLVDNSSRV